MFHLRYNIAVGIAVMVLPVAQAQTAPAAKAGVVQGQASNGAPSKNMAAKAHFDAQPAQQPNPSRITRIGFRQGRCLRLHRSC
jgi:hypothetical protein